MSSSQEPPRPTPGEAGPWPTAGQSAGPGSWPAGPGTGDSTPVPGQDGPPAVPLLGNDSPYPAQPRHAATDPTGFGLVTGPGPVTPGPVPRRGGRSSWALAAVALLAAGALTGVLATPAGKLPSLTGPTSSRPSASASPAATLSPSEVLKKNPIYALKVTGTCPVQRIPSSWNAFQTQVRTLVDCENKAWAKALGTVSIEFSKPRVTFYTKSTDSPCGHLDSNFPASYCSSNQTLYFSRASYQQGRYYRVSVAEFVFHEYAHHVQSLSGIFDASVTLKEDEDITERRTELQAHCIAHYRLTHALKFTSSDRDDVEYQLGYASDAEGHGSAKAGRHWGEAGLNGKNIGACNTWAAKASAVK